MLLNTENTEGQTKGPLNSLDYNQRLNLEENYKNFIS